MITWLTTVEPQTSFSSVEQSFVSQRDNPGAGTTTTNSFTYGTTVERNWSRSATTISSAAAPAGNVFTTSSVSVLGTTNSTSGNSFTRLSTIRQTTTETTRAYSYRATGTVTYGQVVVSSSSVTTLVNGQSETRPTTTFTTRQTQTLSTTQTATAQEQITATTTGAATVATPIFATVVLAERNEMLFAANSSAAIAESGQYKAASDFATTFTRLTIQPWTQTATLLDANPTETTTSTFSAQTYSVSFAESAATATQINSANLFELPNKTQNIQATTGTTITRASTITLFPARTITFRKSQFTTSEMVSTLTTIGAEAFGLSFSSSSLSFATTTRLTSSQTAHTQTESYQEDGFTAQSTTSVQVTSFLQAPEQVTVFSSRAISQSYNFSSGVYNEGGVAGYFTCDDVGAGIPMPLVSRGARSVMPGTFEFSTGSTVFFDEESDIEYGLAGTATVSGLSVTIQSTNTDNTSETFDTSSFVLSAAGQPIKTQMQADGLLLNRNDETRFGFDLNELGASETFFQTIGAGVYRRNGQTFSETYQSQSWVAGSVSEEWIEPLSYLGPSNVKASADLLTWSSSRNTHTDHSILTAAGAYQGNNL